MANKRETAGKLKKHGISALQAGRADEARELFIEACRADPSDAHAWYVLGAIYGQLGRFDEAAEATRKSLALQGKNADAHCNLGVALEGLRRDDEAIAAYRKAIALQPGHIEARKNLAGLLNAAGQQEEAIAQYEHALKSAPRNAALHNDLANALADLDRLDEAEIHYREALKQDPGFSRARINLATLQFRTGARDSAMADLELLLQQFPDDAGVHHNLGEMFQKLGQIDQALRHYDEALRLLPDFVEAYNHKGTVLQLMGRHDEAETVYKRALALRPLYAEATLNLGTLHFECGRIEAALAAFRKAIEIRETFAEAWNNLGNCFIQAGLYQQGADAYEKALSLEQDYWEAASNRLMALHFDPELGTDDLFEAHHRWGDRRVRSASTSSATPAVSGSDRRRLRIGYVSPDFRTHSVAYFIEPILRAHDLSRFEIYCYAEVNVSDATTKRIERIVPNWTNTCGVDDEELADRIRRDGIDILVDLAGHTQGNRLGVFALHPAPIQVSYLGYPDTTGLAAMDYRLTDAVTDPEGQDAGYRERLYRLPAGFLCYGPPQGAPDVSVRPSVRSGGITFASFNNLAKMNEQVVAIWAEILKEVPDARLLLKNRVFGDAFVRQRYIDLFARYGIAEQRLQMTGWTLDNRSHMAMYGEVDIALDTFPYNGTTTTCEAMWMGVPVITLAGRHHVGRVGMSLMDRLGLQALCATDVSEYISLAVKLANRPEKLDVLRASLRPLMRVRMCDALSFTQSLEQAYLDMWNETVGGHMSVRGLEVAE
ncbi:MAG: tetratricopeptide repeat protein [Gammaproteobacteria bacterium]|nr:tetratricopeptide repeat protein [Gammaproteobacteria bacterium]